MGGQPSIYRAVLGGDLTVRAATQIHAQFLDLLEHHQFIEIDCADAQAVDLSFIQIVMAARVSAAAAGVSLALRHEPGSALHDAILCAGVAEAAGGRAFWLGTQGGTA